MIVDEVTFKPFSEAEIRDELSRIEQDPSANENLQAGNVFLGKVDPRNNQAIRLQINKEELIRQAQGPNENRSHYCQFLGLFTLRLDGSRRLALVDEQNGGDLQATPANHLAHLFVNNPLRSEVRRIVFDAFGRFFVIDPTHLGKLRIRLSSRMPVDESEERGLESRSVAFHRAAIDIRDAGDGVKAFTGIVVTVLAGDPKITLVDEPEAFLHPSLSCTLGRELSRHMDSNKRFLVSTHSSNFLMGCIQSKSRMNIVRLTYNYSKPTARLLPTEKILHLMRNPLLRSTGVLNALFYEAVVVAEADVDRAFYQEINERLIASEDPRGILNCLFINARNKQAVWEIIQPLRELGIPAVGLVDVDIVKEGGKVFSKMLSSCFVPDIEHHSLHSKRQSILKALVASGEDMKVRGGVALLDESDREGAHNFFDFLADYGVFVVRGGEVESWLKSLGVNGHGPSWLYDMFVAMGEDPESPEYVHPGVGDVWDFIGDVKSWSGLATRKGIPQ